MIKRTFTLFFTLVAVQWLFAQIPANYYDHANGTQGRQLKTAMFHIIKEHDVCSYSSLMDHFKKTDRRVDGKVWDMYSCTTNYSYGGGSARYSGEGAGYNREHSFPKSWFGGKVSPMYTDLFHIYPTDGYINNRRWHYAFGETAGETYTSDKGWSKLGASTIPGCNETVFEPNDEYKGDFARTYFYMATCYEDKIGGWKTLNNKADGEPVPMLNQTAYPCFQKWALDMLLRWAKQDPVSQKEIDRNNAVYGIQNNRNPYIDFPGLEEYVWGDSVNVPFNPENFDSNGGGEVNPQPDDQYLAAPSFSVYSGEVTKGTQVVISCSEPDANIVYAINEGEETTAHSSVTLEVNEDMTVTAYATLGEKVSKTVTATYTVKAPPVIGQGAFVKVMSMDELTEGARYLLVCESKETALSAQDDDIRSYVEVTIYDFAIDTEVSAPRLPYALTLGKDAKGYTLYDAADKIYLSLNSSSNKLHRATSAEGDEAHWTISISNQEMEIKSVKYPTRGIRYNAGAPRFATYTQGQQPVSLYKETSVSGINAVLKAKGSVDVYDSCGRLVRHAVLCDEALQGLPSGFYIVGGKKVLVK